VKPVVTLILLIFFSHILQASPVVHTITYRCEGAGEVNLVWGVDNWQIPVQVPPGSFVKDRLVYTALNSRSGGRFSTTLSIPEGVKTLDFVFQIVRGPFGKTCDIWDANVKPHKDYHAAPCANAETVILSSVTVPPAAQVSALDAAGILLAGAAIALVAAIALRRRFGTDRNWISAPGAIIAGIVAVMICQILMRPAVAGFSWHVVASPLASFPQLLYASRFDLFFTAAVGLFFLLIDRAARKKLMIRRANVIVFLIFSVISATWSITNERLVALIGRPVNFQWLYYGDLLHTGEGWSAISANLTSGYVSSLLLVLIAGVMLALSFMHLSALRVFVSRRIVYSVATACTLPAIWIGAFSDAKMKLSSEKTANPIVAMLQSVNPFEAPPALFTADVPDSLKFRETKEKTQLPSGLPKLKNVIVIVLESTGAGYVDLPEKTFGMTPFLQSLSGHAWVATNVYAPAPATNLSMFSMMTGSYPWISYQSVTDRYTSFPIPSIASVFSARGYRTAFFNSGDNGYQRAGQFLSEHGFQVTRDCNDGSCNSQKLQVQSSGWEHMNGRRDACTADEMLKWIENRDGRPFFAAMWTYQTHYPYFHDGPKSAVVSDESFNRYLYALHDADSVVATICQRLERSGTLDSTLVVVVGDHGEAFGQHGQVTHARGVYDENLRVPCLFYNPRLNAKRFEQPGSVVDVSPTILTLLGVPVPDAWDGQALLTEKNRSPVFFFAPWSGEHFGMRQGSKKFIYEARNGEYELYDLAHDPHELNNLATGNERNHECLQVAGWVQYVNRRFSSLSGR
jgi:lipoteichoic acid synthase